MTRDEWARIESVFREAHERAAGAERSAYLDEACGSDDTLRRNVERLLAGEEESSLDSPVANLLGQVVEAEFPEMNAGDQLGPYRVEEKIGQGGMGAVYRAYDSRLRRMVALKIIRPTHALDEHHKQRLLREARAASALNHSNIVTIYEIGEDQGFDFIAMEYVVGRTLAEEIGGKALPVGQLLHYAIQIAAALAKAHEAKILHRDVKPSNIIVTSDGLVKVLDFGLAKSFERQPGDELSTVNTLTGQGMTPGTAGYMSPEQVEGRTLDARSDLFSFGCVLYEMASGTRPFRGDSLISTLHKILNEEAPQLRAIPKELEGIIGRALRKNPDRRFQTASDLKAALEDLSAQVSPASQSKRLRSWMAAAAVAVVVALAALGSWLWSHRPMEEAPATAGTVKFAITSSGLGRQFPTEQFTAISLSLDGRKISWVEQGSGQLWIRDLGAEQPYPVPGATRSGHAFFSPDGLSIVYADNPARAVSRKPIKGGQPERLFPMNDYHDGDWSSDGKEIVYSDAEGLHTMPAAGGTPTLIIPHRHLECPRFLDLPGGKRAFLYQASDLKREGHGLYVQLEGSNEPKLIRWSNSGNPWPTYSLGHIVYGDGRAGDHGIWALPFSLERLEATGEPFEIAKHASPAKVSHNGVLVYSDLPSNNLQLIWMDRTGKRLGPVGGVRETARTDWAVLSPDGHKVAFEMNSDIWVLDLASGAQLQITNDRNAEYFGTWSPDGEIVFVGEANWNFYSIPATGKGRVKELLNTPEQKLGPQFSPDGKYVIYGVRVATKDGVQDDIIYREKQPDGSLGAPQTFLAEAYPEQAPTFSPDGRLVAYVSREAGKSTVFVREFPSGSKAWLIGEGSAPHWNKKGTEIYTQIYARPGNRVMASSVSRSGADLLIGRQVELFQQPLPLPCCDVAGDGNRFLVWEAPSDPAPLQIHVVYNWLEEFRAARQKAGH